MQCSRKQDIDGIRVVYLPKYNPDFRQCLCRMMRYSGVAVTSEKKIRWCQHEYLVKISNLYPPLSSLCQRWFCQFHLFVVRPDKNWCHKIWQTVTSPPRRLRQVVFESWACICRFVKLSWVCMYVELKESAERLFFVKIIHTRMMIKLKTKYQQIVLERIRNALWSCV